jgi:hypothetical protein
LFSGAVSIKLKLFEILQSGSDDNTFSNWAKRKINENSNTADSEKTKTPIYQASIQRNQ